MWVIDVTNDVNRGSLTDVTFTTLKFLTNSGFTFQQGEEIEN